MNRTINDLTATLADALGIEREVVADHAHHLFPNDNADTDDAQAEPEHAAALLISLMAGVPPAKAPDAVRLYGGLPLDCVDTGGTHQNGQWVSIRIPDDDPFMENLTTLGNPFGEFLAGLIGWFNEAPEIDFEVVNFVLGGGLGTASATIYFGVLIDGASVVGNIKFNLVPFGGGTLPDDAARCRLDREATVPGAILSVLREFFTGAPGGPREVFMSRADLARLSQELDS